MGREAKVTYEQVAAVATAMCAANLIPTEKAVRAQVGNVGSAGTIHRMLKEWKGKRDKPAAQPFAVPAVVQQALSEFVAQERSAATSELELELADARETLADVSLENERQQAAIEEQANVEVAMRAELAMLQERVTLIPRLEADLATLREDVKADRRAHAEATQQGKADREALRAEVKEQQQARAEASKQAIADLDALRADVNAERKAHAEAAMQVAVLEAKLVAAQERAVQAQSFRTELEAAGDGHGAFRRNQAAGSEAKTTGQVHSQ